MVLRRINLFAIVDKFSCPVTPSREDVSMGTLVASILESRSAAHLGGLALLAFCVRGVWLTPCEDRRLKRPPEVVNGAEDARVGEVGHAEELHCVQAHRVSGFRSRGPGQQESGASGAFRFHIPRSFCMGVPDSKILLSVGRLAMAGGGARKSSASGNQWAQAREDKYKFTQCEAEYR